MVNIYKTIKSFYDNIKGDKNHRYRSWEHCYSYFKEDKNKIDKEIACLHLAFYLASWGMYRGSSPLLWKDYLIHRGAIDEILKFKNLQKSTGEGSEIGAIIDLSVFLKKYYKNEIKHINGRKKDYEPSDVLVSKILLGTLGCIPAYDRYFVDGIRINKKIHPLKFNRESVENIWGFYNRNNKEFDKVRNYIKKYSKVDYPPMKLVDMYFWQLGYENDKNKVN